MNKRINTHLALIVILFLAIGVTVYTLLSSRNIESEISNSSKKQEVLKPTPKKQEQKQNTCQARAYEGAAEVRVWQKEETEKMILQVSSEDAIKIPPKNDASFQLIDPTPELEQKITKSSEKNPVKIKISGFATLCDGTYLASLEYKEGIFRPYIK